jgi:polyphosphate glucokinase
MKKILGIDVGATGIKGAIVDIETGKLITERLKIKTPKPATPAAILKTIKELKVKLGYTGKTIGIGFPSVVKNGLVLSAANIDKTWINYPIVEKYSKGLDANVYIINDADAAGLAEMKFGNIKKKKGFIIFLTLGTGIGSALFLNGTLMPNTEFGHIHFKDSVAEKYASNSARELKGLTWRVWATELNNYLKHLQLILNPDSFIIGGGVSKNFEMYRKYLTVTTPVYAATLQNAAGVIGAAMGAHQKIKV